MGEVRCVVVRVEVYGRDEAVGGMEVYGGRGGAVGGMEGMVGWRCVRGVDVWEGWRGGSGRLCGREVCGGKGGGECGRGGMDVGGGSMRCGWGK